MRNTEQRKKKRNKFRREKQIRKHQVKENKQNTVFNPDKTMEVWFYYLSVTTQHPYGHE